MSYSPRDLQKPIIQDMPPPGGYAKIDFSRSLSPRGPKGWQIWSGTFACIFYGFYKMGQTNNDRKQQQALERKARYNLAPILQAEADREYMERELILLKKEAEMMKDTPNWRVGQNVYNTGWFYPRAVFTKWNES